MAAREVPGGSVGLGRSCGAPSLVQVLLSKDASRVRVCMEQVCETGRVSWVSVAGGESLISNKG